MSPFASSDADQLSSQLVGAGEAIGDVDAVDALAAQAIVDAASPITPRATGALAAATRAIGNEVVNARSYAAPVHWGWSRGSTTVAARPWLVQAAQVAEPQIEDLYETHIDEGLRTIK
jgi:hypothetical protein